MAEAKIVVSAVDQTKAAIDSAKRNMEGLAKNVEQAKTVVEGFLASEVVLKMAEWAKGTIEAGDAMNDLSQRVGIAVEDLAKYKLATGQSGTSMESLAKGIKGLSTNMLEHGDALKAAGITATTADGAMQQLADVFAGMPDGMEKTALAVKVFGKAGMDLIPMLNMGSAGLKEASEKSAAYAATMKVFAPQADKFNDNLAEISLYSHAAAISMTSSMMPALIDITNQMAEAASKGGTLKGVMAGLDALGNNMFDWSGNAQRKNIANLSEDLQNLREEQAAITSDVFGSKGRIQTEIEEKIKALNTAKSAYFGFTDVKGGRGSTNPALATPKKAISPEIQALLDALSGKAGGGATKDVLSEYDKLIAKLGTDVAKAAGDAEAAQMGYNKSQAEFIALTKTNAWANFSEGQKTAVATLYEARIQSDLLTESTKALEKADLEAAQAHEKYITSLIDGLSKYQDESEALRETNDRLGLNKEAIAALDAIKLESKATTLDLMAIKVLDKNLDEAQYNIYKAQAEELRSQAMLKKTGAAKSTALDAADAANKLSKDAAQSLHDDVKNALSTAFHDSKDPVRAFGDALGNVIFTRVTNSLADAMATQFLNSSIGTSLLSIFGLADGGIMSDKGSVPLHAYSSGGIANSPQLAVFGEGRMNEAFVPLPDGRSIPVSMKGGGQAITVVQNFTVGDVASISMVKQAVANSQRQIVSAFARSQNYGGAVA
jgi:hypothetical protein